MFSPIVARHLPVPLRGIETSQGSGVRVGHDSLGIGRFPSGGLRLPVREVDLDAHDFARHLPVPLRGIETLSADRKPVTDLSCSAFAGSPQGD